MNANGLQAVAVLVLPDVVPFDLAIATHVFGDAKPFAGVPRYRLILCGPSSGLIPMAGGVPIGVPVGLEGLAAANTIIIPGRSDADAPVALEILSALKAASVRGARLLSICTGAFVLAQAGLLNGRRATTHWAHAQRLANTYPSISVDARVLYIDDAGVMTSAGMAAGIDLCLHVVRLDHGAEAANAIARRMVVAPHRTGGQAQFIEQPIPETRDTNLQRTQAWVLEHLDRRITVADMARQANTSPRHFTRRFNSEFGIAPLRWLLNERVRLAQRLLEQTDLSIEQVGARAGFGSAIALRRQFLAALGTTPTAYRLTFRGAEGVREPG